MQYMWEHPDRPSKHIDALTDGIIQSLTILIMNAIQLRGKHSGMQDQLVATVRLMVTSLYSLKMKEKLLCLQPVATLVNNDIWMGKWKDLPNGRKDVWWFARSEPAMPILAHFFASNTCLGRQQHCNKFWDRRVTPQLICLAVTALNCALRDYKKGTKSEPSQDFQMEIFRHLCAPSIL
jgi:hypothetical protein